MKPEEAIIKSKQETEAEESKEMPPIQESPEAVKRQIIEESEKETDGFKNEGHKRLADIEKIADSESLLVDEEDKKKLAVLDREAEAAENELKRAIQPGFLKEFSKERRGELAQDILKKREKRREKQEEERADTERLDSLRVELAEISKTSLKRFSNYFKIKKINSEILGLETNIEDRRKFSAGKIERASFNLEMQKDVADFYQWEQAKWESTPYNKEEVAKLFSEEHLASLTLADYALLLKRFPSEMVTHVTRQGVRDHTGHMWHTSGTDKYHSGFTELVNDGRLRAHWGRHFEQNEKNEAIAKALRLGEKYKTKEEALRYLDELTDTSGQIRHLESYADYNAIHVATEEVADEYYGAERGNEIFFIFSSNQIASQCYFNGALNERDRSRPNDQWVWTNENRGIDINSGIVFIPKEAMVNPKTGSKYEIDSDGQVAQDEKQKKVVEKFIESSDFESFAKKAIAVLNNIDSQIKTEDLERELDKDYGIKDEHLKRGILNPGFLNKALEKGKSVVAIEEKWLFYKESSKTITSMDFWENYFKDHPGKKPSKIVYYEGGDPTQAIAKWKEQNGLTKKQRKGDMDFPENKRDQHSPEANAGIERFKSLAKEVVDNYFSGKPEGRI